MKVYEYTGWDEALGVIPSILDTPEDYSLALLRGLLIHNKGSLTMYAPEWIEEVDESYVDLVVSNALYSNKFLLDSILKSLEIAFDPLVNSSMTTTNNLTKEFDEETTGEGTDAGTSTNTTSGSSSTDGTNTSESTDQKNTYESGTLYTTGKQSGSGTDHNEATNSQTSSGGDSRNSTSSGTRKYTDKDTGTVKNEGFASIDYAKALKDVYETKMINWYNSLLEIIVGQLTYSDWFLQ